MSHIDEPAVGILFALTVLSSGLYSSPLGTIAGQVRMEKLTGNHANIWLRRIVTRSINVFPTTITILLGYGPLVVLIHRSRSEPCKTAFNDSAGLPHLE